MRIGCSIVVVLLASSILKDGGFVLLIEMDISIVMMDPSIALVEEFVLASYYNYFEHLPVFTLIQLLIKVAHLASRVVSFIDWIQNLLEG
jgi:hypothetical protein